MYGPNLSPDCNKPYYPPTPLPPIAKGHCIRQSGAVDYRIGFLQDLGADAAVPGCDALLWWSPNDHDF